MNKFQTVFAGIVLLMSFFVQGGEVNSSAELSTPAAWLKAQPKPEFRTGHTLPPLTRYGWDMDDAVRVSLAEDWGYALEFGIVSDETVARALNEPNSREARRLALVHSDPKRFRLSVESNRKLPKETTPDVWTRNKEGKFLNAKARSFDGNEWHPEMETVFSLVSPDAFWRSAANLSAEPIQKLRARCPVTIVLNGGEYGIGVAGFAQKVWAQDPDILKAKGEKSWPDFVSERKAYYQGLMTQAERAAAPDRLLYIYYTAGGGTHRNVIPDWGDWSYTWETFKGNSDLPSNEAYFRHFNSGFTGDRDILTLCLNAAAREIAGGKPLSYNWLSAGWEGEPGHSHADIARWTGFLKCYYTAGMIGGIEGYYQYLGKDGFSKPFPSNNPPHWLQQLTALAHVHALFSHAEDFLRQGDLLPGPDKNRFSKELPACELPTGDKDVRVLVRKHKNRAEWLVTAWAAGGNSREVKVSVPELGDMNVTARINGAVYQAIRVGEMVVLTRLD